MAEGNYITEAITAVAVVLGGIWAKFSFVQKSDFDKFKIKMADQLYEQGGRSRYKYRDDCSEDRTICLQTQCNKFDEIKEVQKDQNKKIDALIKGQEQIFQWIKDRTEK